MKNLADRNRTEIRQARRALDADHANLTRTIPLQFLRDNAHVTDTRRPMLLDVLLASDVAPRDLAYHSRNPELVESLIAADFARKLRDAGLRALCLGGVPTEHGAPVMSRANSDADVFVDAINGVSRD
jgi:hypothetical protein